MAEITIPDTLLREIDEARAKSITAEQFVADAVREKLARHRKKMEFFHLSDETRRRMESSGRTEDRILADFEGFRESLRSE